MPRVLITGAAGFIGMHTALKMLDNGWEVVGIDNLNTYYSTQLKNDRLRNIQRHNSRENFTFYEADINDFDFTSIHKLDCVIHLAAQAGVRYSIENPMAYLKSNILGFQNVIDFVKEQAISNFLYASSSSVYGNSNEVPFKEDDICNNPESYYAATKISNELTAKSYYHVHGIKSIGLRFFTVYGPWGRPDMAPMLFANSILNEDEIKVFNYGNQSRDFTYIDDIIEGIYSIVNSKTNYGADVFNIGKGSPDELMEFINQLEMAIGKKAKKRFYEAQPGDVVVTFASIAKLHRTTGYKPWTNLETGIEKFINWFREYHSDKS